MYNLSPRWRKLQPSSTPVNLAPNHYHLDGYNYRNELKNRVGFLSSAPRNDSITSKIYTDAVYDVAIPSTIVGGSCMKSKTARKTDRPPDTPGPGKYNVKEIRTKAYRTVSAPPRGKKLYVCRVPFYAEAKGPSIPTTLDENGYSFNKSGRLVKNQPDSHDTTLGPAFYSVPTEQCLTTQLYKGCYWSRLRSKRAFFPASSDSPGPAAYDSSVKKLVDAKQEETREMARLLAPSCRFLEIQENQILKDNFPSPADYYPKLPEPQKSLSLNPAAFSTRHKRDTFATNSDSPPPNIYKIPESMLKRSVSIKDTAFNMETSRFPTKEEYPTPGPGDYDIPSNIEAKLQKALDIHSDDRPAFNHSAPRTMIKISNNPSPAEYNVEAKPKELQSCEGSVFRSNVLRFKPAKYKQAADPATYCVTEQFNKNKDSKSHSVTKVPFLSTRDRSQAITPSNALGPDPCKYKYHTEMSTKGFYIARGRRFEDDGGDETPGPGCYTIHPSEALSMYKAMSTHNLMLKERILRSKLRQHPDKTRRQFLKNLQRTKTLAAFYRPPPPKICSWMNLG